MKKNYKILFLGKKNCLFSKKIARELKRYSSKVSCIFHDKKKKNLQKFFLKWSGDYIFSFRSHFIISKDVIDKAKIAAINFHPGPPKYRGIGCVNFSILNDEKTYGSTCHLMTRKIDQGKIIDVKNFKVHRNYNIDSILRKTYQLQYYQFKKVVKKLFQNTNNLNKMINKSKKEKWSAKLYTKKQLDELYKMNIGSKFKKIKIDRYLRATVTKNYMPFIEINKFFFYLNNEK